MSLRVGVVGLQHPHIEDFAEYVRAQENLEFVGWAEEDADRRADIERRFGARTFASRDALFDSGVDVIGIGAANRDRGEVVLDALRRGVHVVVDKPMMLSLDEVVEARSLTRSHGLHATALLTERFNPPTRRLHEVVQGGEIGDVVAFSAFRPHKLKIDTRPDWMFDHRTYGGPIADLAIHDLDVLRWITGREPEIVAAWQANHATPSRPDFFDAGHVTLRDEAGTSAWISVSWLTPAAAAFHGDCRYLVQGTRGSAEVLTCRGAGEDAIFVTTDERPLRRLEVGSADSAAFYGSFFDAVRGRGEPMLPSEEAFRSTELSLRAQALADRAATDASGGGTS